METYTVTKELWFCYGHRLLNYDGKCKYFHGHNAKVEITLGGAKLDRRGMVVDFTDIKTTLQPWIDENLDHKMLLCKDDPMISVMKEKGEPFYEMKDNPTAENIAKLIFHEAVKKRLPVQSVKLWETESSCATYSAVQDIELKIED